MDKCREQFEEWYAAHWGCTEDNIESMFDRSPYNDEYYRFGVRLAFDAWQASHAIALKINEKE